MKQALAYFEGNEYKQAFKRMKQLVEQERSVENLHNLAWLYLNEEEDLNMGQKLAEEAVELGPNHHFPHALLAEIYLRKNDLPRAEVHLHKVLEKHRIPSIIHNLGVLYAKKRQWTEAANYFQECAKMSSYIQIIEIYCHIQANDIKAKDILLQWDESQDDFIGWSEAADLWIELGEFTNAKEGFEKEWGITFPSPYIVKRYSYVLYRLGKEEELMNIQKQTLANIEQEVEEVQKEIDWLEEDKNEQIQELEEWREEVTGLLKNLKKGYVPPYEIDIYVEGGCYLFGCSQHNHPFYRGDSKKRV
ncbi:hypothetical protein M3649_09230 [Ureibacillus chungkukjangi]|uniref:tetratricopeptide repeat protein n=1 Tax=Ureibacillus chungkukjangi TaxID=1202712 RepID=UPI00203CBF9D|nr:tetratricopeptide repeat protein [Ureibacillus chungkukjangi]MCM3388315.1 hypothetical protein [Ureibacillus chungkukjangi]